MIIGMSDIICQYMQKRQRLPLTIDSSGFFLGVVIESGIERGGCKKKGLI